MKIPGPARKVLPFVQPKLLVSHPVFPGVTRAALCKRICHRPARELVTILCLFLLFIQFCLDIIQRNNYRFDGFLQGFTVLDGFLGNGRNGFDTFWR